MAGAEELVAAIDRLEGVEYSGLVLNERGWERFRAVGLDRVNVTFGATESFNRRNGNASLEEAVRRTEAILDAADGTPATVTISVAFGCPFEGRVDPGVVVELAARVAGRAEVVLWQTGATPLDGLGIPGRRSAPYGELQSAFREADVVVSHAGIGSALEVMDAGRMPLLVPRRPSLGDLASQKRPRNARRTKKETG